MPATASTLRDMETEGLDPLCVEAVKLFLLKRTGDGQWYTASEIAEHESIAFCRESVFKVLNRLNTLHRIERKSSPTRFRMSPVSFVHPTAKALREADLGDGPFPPDFTHADRMKITLTRLSRMFQDWRDTGERTHEAPEVIRRALNALCDLER